MKNASGKDATETHKGANERNTKDREKAVRRARERPPPLRRQRTRERTGGKVDPTCTCMLIFFIHSCSELRHW